MRGAAGAGIVRVFPPRLFPTVPLSRPTKAVLFQLGTLALMVIAGTVAGQFFPLDKVIGRVGEWLAGARPWSYGLYPGALALANLLLLPAGLLVVGGGFYFGMAKGFALMLAGHLLGAAAAFAITRRWARGWVEARLLRSPRWRALDLAIAREGWKIVFLTQLNPLSPTSLMHYFYGATRLRFWPTMAWVALGQAPGMFLYVYLGRLGSFSWRVWREGRAQEDGALWLWLGGLAVTLWLTVALARLAFRLLDEAQQRALMAEAVQASREQERAAAEPALAA